MESIGRLAGGIAHDFNNLLTAILGYTELLLSNRPADDPDRSALEEIQKAGMRAASLTQQLLAFSRKQVLLPQEVDLNLTVLGLQSMLTRRDSRGHQADVRGGRRAGARQDRSDAGRAGDSQSGAERPRRVARRRLDPARCRASVGVRGRGGRPMRRWPTRMSGCASATTASAFPRARGRICSSRSSPRKNRGRAPASGWRRCTGSCIRATAGST